MDMLEAFRTLNRHAQERISPSYIIVHLTQYRTKTLYSKHQEKKAQFFQREDLHNNIRPLSRNSERQDSMERDISSPESK